MKYPMPIIEENYFDEAAADTEQVKRARTLIKEALGIARRTKVSARAEQFLRWADDNLRHPGPRMLVDVWRLPDKEREGIDFGNGYVTLGELCELTKLSRTTIRTMVNEGYLEQEHRGLYRLHDFFDAWRWYQERPR